VFETLTKSLRVEVQSLVRTAVWAAVGASMALVGVFFLAVTVFLATSESYGRLAAAVSLAICLFAVAGAAVGVLLLVQSKARKDAAKRAETLTIGEQQHDQRMPPVWKDAGVLSAVLPAALKVAQFGFRNRALIGVAASSAAIALALFRNRRKNEEEVRAAAE
jgi:Kef-type K+ transport system membrane component KefB